MNNKDFIRRLGQVGRPESSDRAYAVMATTRYTKALTLIEMMSKQLKEYSDNEWVYPCKFPASASLAEIDEFIITGEIKLSGGRK